MKKKTKEKVRKFFRSVALYMMFILIGVVITISLFYYNNNAFNINKYVSNSINTINFNAFTYSNLYDNYTTEVVEFCKGFYGTEQVNCVVSQYSFIFNYTEHNKTIKTPTELKNTGGVCRDAAVFYSTVFVRLGWTYSYNYPIPNHVNIIVRSNYNINNTTIYYECLVEQNEYNCVIY